MLSAHGSRGRRRPRAGSGLAGGRCPRRTVSCLRGGGPRLAHGHRGGRRPEAAWLSASGCWGTLGQLETRLNSGGTLFDPFESLPQASGGRPAPLAGCSGSCCPVPGGDGHSGRVLPGDGALYSMWAPAGHRATPRPAPRNPGTGGAQVRLQRSGPLLVSRRGLAGPWGFPPRSWGSPSAPGAVAGRQWGAGGICPPGPAPCSPSVHESAPPSQERGGCTWGVGVPAGVTANPSTLRITFHSYTCRRLIRQCPLL